MSRAISRWIGFGACLLILAAPSMAYSDFIVTNMLAEVAVSAGGESDGVGDHTTTSASLSAMDGVQGTSDFQIAQAEFLLTVEQDNGLGDYVLNYESEAFAMTGGIGNANAIANGIIVFRLTEEFEVIGLVGDTVFNNALGEPVPLAEGESQLFDAGIYSLSFGSSAIVNPNSPSFENSVENSGVVAFNTTSIPEPSTATISLALIGLAGFRRRNRLAV